MIYYIKGKLAELTPQYAVIDCQGVGYSALISTLTYDKLVNSGAYLASGEIAEIDAKLYTTVKIKDENSFETYGFYTRKESVMFNLLQTVSGIGPKAALSILSTLSPDTICTAIRQDDIRLLSKAQGVGQKAAQKLCIDLKNKLDGFVLEFGTDDDGTDNVSRETSFLMQSESQSENQKLALDALVNLGYTKAQATKALSKAQGDSVEDLIRTALSQLF